MRTLLCILRAVITQLPLPFPQHGFATVALIGIGMVALAPTVALSQDVMISEVLAENRHGLIDGSGLKQDWIELENQSGSDVSLAGWQLTDDPGQLDKWTFPTHTLRAHERMVVFASGRNQIDAAGYLHTNFRISSSGEYLALIRPDRSIANEFKPMPPQLPDVSFGPGPAVSILTVVSNGSIRPASHQRGARGAGSEVGGLSEFMRFSSAGPTCLKAKPSTIPKRRSTNRASQIPTDG